jgi:membrane-bound lytic murein transglycosylase D
MLGWEMKKLPLIFLLAVVLGLTAKAQYVSAPDSNQTESSVITNNLDQLMNLWFMNRMSRDTNVEDMNIYGFLPGEIPEYTDSIYKYRLAKLNSPIPLAYNSYVRNYIELYTIRKRDQVERMLGLAHYYFPIFEEELDKEGLPLELRNVAIIESALNTHAVSKSGATGMWQFIYSTAKLYDLKITSYVDERRDPYKLTETAVVYLKDLYNVYNDWLMVIAAYNCGPGSLNKAIKRSGNKKNIWEIYPYLPLETRGYVPAFIAANYVMNYYREHNLYPRVFYNPGLTDTVHVYQRLRFDVLSKSLSMPIEQLRELNPMYRKDEIPQSFTETGYVLRLPIDKATYYSQYHDLVYKYQTYLEQQYRDSLLANNNPPPKYTSDNTVKFRSLHYKVKSGDKLENIAEWYECTVNDLKKWNHLKSTYASVGRSLIVYVPTTSYTEYLKINTMSFAEKQQRIGKLPVDSNAPPPQLTSVNTPGNNQPNVTKPIKNLNTEYVYYTIKSGDTLWTIAQKYPGVTTKQLMALNNITQTRSLKPGQKIKIKPKG